jgi:predicted RNA-binding protein with PUA-like domain
MAGFPRPEEGRIVNYFLAKTDPETYGIDDLQREGRTVWDGVHNALALRAIKEMRPGDEVLIYHSQGQAAIVGVARVVSEPRPDPNDPKSWVVDFEYLRKLARPVTLSEIKSSHLFDDWNLVRQGRLSTMSTPPQFIEWLKELESL